MLSELTDEKAEEVRQAFKVYDRDNDNHLNISELRSAMRALALNPTEEELQQTMSELDGDAKGKIYRDDFYAYMVRKLRSYDPEEELIEAFKVFDADDSGLISMKELRDAMQHLGENLFAEEIDEMAKEAKPDNNDKVDYREFIKVILKDQTTIFKVS